MKNRTVKLSAIAVAGLLALSGCTAGATGSGDAAASDSLKGLTGQIGSKDFAEQYILAYMTADLLNANGAQVEANTKLVGSNNVRQALENGDFIGYWEYTGTSWISYNKQTAPIADPAEQFDAVKKLDGEKGIAWIDPAPFNNTYAFAILSDKAKELGVKTLSDVAKLPVDQQTFCIESEFSTRDDGWPGLKAAYGINVPDSNVKMLDTGVIYTATAEGKDCNFGEVFATDGRIASLKLQVMADDKKFFPVYQGALTISKSVLDKYPAIADIMAKLSPLLTDEVMQSLNAKVDVDGEDPADVAKQFLQEKGLIK